MYSTRGVKFKFSEGERVLCYEPDPTKAKVLYESKVLDLVVSRDERGRKVPEYLIHFFGWNSSWDRCVREEFILPYTEENRELQTKLAKDAALSMKGKRKSKLPPLIKETLAKKQCSDSESQDTKPPESPPQSSSESESSEEEMEREVVINIPDVLKAQLEEDWRHITQKDKFVKLPCQPNVIAILEAYVKHLAANLLCASPPKNAKNGKQLMPEDVKNKLNLCKEAVDGIRVYFDFTLAHLLLYRQEKKQYYTYGTTCAPVSYVKCEPVQDEQKSIVKSEVEDNGNTMEVTVTVAKDVSASTVKKDNEPVMQSRAQRGRLSLRNQPNKSNQCIKSENIVNGSSDSKSQSPSQLDKSCKKPARGRPKTACTRILRSSDKQKQQVATEGLSAKVTIQPIEIETSQAETESQPESTNSLRITRKSVQNASPPPIPNASPPPIPNASSSQSPRPQPVDKMSLINSVPSFQCNQAPPSLSVASNCMSSSNSSSHSTLSSPMLQGQPYHFMNNYGVLQEVLSWSMVPQHLYEQIPAAPSLIYGAQHLLRLFVKLPDLIAKMSMSQRKFEPLLNILENFLQYVAEKKDELFLESAYIDSKEIFPDINLAAVK